MANAQFPVEIVISVATVIILIRLLIKLPYQDNAVRNEETEHSFFAVKITVKSTSISLESREKQTTECV